MYQNQCICTYEPLMAVSENHAVPQTPPFIYCEPTLFFFVITDAVIVIVIAVFIFQQVTKVAHIVISIARISCTAPLKMM